MKRDPELASGRAKQDQLDMTAIKRASHGDRGRYGARKACHQLRRGGHNVARCAVERLMRVMGVMGLQGVVRGKKVITTNPDAAQPCPDDKVNRAFVAAMPNQLSGSSIVAPLVHAQWTTISPMSPSVRALAMASRTVAIAARADGTTLATVPMARHIWRSNIVLEPMADKVSLIDVLTRAWHGLEPLAAHASPYAGASRPR